MVVDLVLDHQGADPVFVPQPVDIAERNGSPDGPQTVALHPRPVIDIDHQIVRSPQAMETDTLRAGGTTSSRLSTSTTAGRSRISRPAGFGSGGRWLGRPPARPHPWSGGTMCARVPGRVRRARPATRRETRSCRASPAQAAHRITGILGFQEPVAFVPCRGGRRYLVLAESLDLFELDDFDAGRPQLVDAADTIGHRPKRTLRPAHRSDLRRHPGALGAFTSVARCRPVGLHSLHSRPK